MQIRVLGAHNCQSQNTNLAALLVDDALALDAGGLASSLPFETQLNLKAILLTHQHYDHIRDIPAIAMNALLHETTISIYSIPAVRDVMVSHLMDDKIYPDFLKRPEENPAVKFTVVEPDQAVTVEGYSVLPVSVSHSVPAVGYQVTSADGKVIFYTGDTGPGIIECWQRVMPQLLIIESTAPNRYEDFARRAGHLTPDLIKQELESFREVKGYLPQVIVVHMNPVLEKEIEAEIASVAKSLNCPVTLACEGMILNL